MPIKVAVIRGGISPEYDMSLKTGAEVLRTLKNDLPYRYITSDVLLDRSGKLYMNGLKTSWNEIASKADVIWNALHGEYGEDGKIQEIFETIGIPYTGSRAQPSLDISHAKITRENLERAGILIPTHFLIPSYNEVFDSDVDEWAMRKAREIHGKMPPPWVVRPVRGGLLSNSILVKTLPGLAEAFKNLADSNDDILVEELITGHEVSVGVVENFRNNPHYTFLPASISHRKDAFSDYLSKQDGKETISSLGNLNVNNPHLEELARTIHKALNLSHYSKSDFVVHPKRGVYCINVNTLPPLGENSLMPKMLGHIGSSMSEFVDHVLVLAMKGK